MDTVSCLVPQSQSSLAFGAAIAVVGYCNFARFRAGYLAIVRLLLRRIPRSKHGGWKWSRCYGTVNQP